MLTSTLHDPGATLMDVLPIACENIARQFDGWVVNVTDVTHPSIMNTLEGTRGVYVSHTDKGSYPAVDGIERDHLSAVKHGLQMARILDSRGLMYCDGDRLSMAGAHYAPDVADMALTVGRTMEPEKTYLTFPRSKKDFADHHPALVYTEDEIVRLYSRSFGCEVDPGSTTHAMSLDIAEGILSQSEQLDPVSFPHPKWLFIAHRLGAPIQSIPTNNVLRFETAEQQRAKIEGIYRRKFDSYDELVKAGHLINAYDEIASPREWKLRLNTEGQYLSFLRKHLPEIVAEEDRAHALDHEIGRTLTDIETAWDMLTGEYFGKPNPERPSFARA